MSVAKVRGIRMPQTSHTVPVELASYPLTGNVGPRSVISRKVPARFETCVSGYRSVLCSCGFRMRSADVIG